MRSSLFVALLLPLLACTTYRDQLSRGQRAFELNEHDRTLAILRDLEPDVRHLTVPEQAEYAYLRGMTDYRVGYKPDARHWLSIAKAYEDNSPGVLPADWKLRTNEALDEMNGVVYSAGLSTLTTSRSETPVPESSGPGPGPAARDVPKAAPPSAKPEPPKADAPKSDAPAPAPAPPAK